MILNPQGMEVIAWTDAMNLLLSINDSVKLADPDDWRVWANNLLGEADRLGQDMPDPAGFDDWREWAELLFLTIELDG